MEKKKLPAIEITELYLIKADWERTFLANIYREADKNGKPIVHGYVIVTEGMIWSSAETAEELAKNLDDICVMKLDMALHTNAGVRIKLFSEDFFLS